MIKQLPVGETNEPTAAVELFRGMLLKGKLIVGDAIFCQREVCQTIREREGHYLVWAKDNQPTLLKDARSVFVDPAGLLRRGGEPTPFPPTANGFVKSAARRRTPFLRIAVASRRVR